MDTEIAKPSFLISHEAIVIEKRLREAAVGQVVTWQSLSDEIGRDATTIRGAIQTARKHLLNDGIVFGSVRGVGFKRLLDGEIIKQEGTTHRKVSRTVNRSLKRLATVKADALENGTRQEYATTCAVLGALKLCTQPSAVSKVKQLVIGNNKADGAEALRLFAK